MKTYLIAGGSSGIGHSIAIDLLKDGMRVISLSRSSNHGLNHENLQHFTCDFTKPMETFPVIDEKIDGLIYCPGTILLRPFRALKQEEFLHDLEVNYLGAIKAIQKYLPNLQVGENPSIVLFSTVAVQKGMPFHASIAGAKGAIEGLTRSLAAEFAPKIRVNAIAPSLTQTPLADKLINSESKLQAAADRHPLKRIGQTEDLSQAARYLLEATWVTGQIISVSGGL